MGELIFACGAFIAGVGVGIGVFIWGLGEFLKSMDEIRHGWTTDD